jgi:hypothetical protein
MRLAINNPRRRAFYAVLFGQRKKSRDLSAAQIVPQQQMIQSKSPDQKINTSNLSGRRFRTVWGVFGWKLESMDVD